MLKKALLLPIAAVITILLLLGWFGGEAQPVDHQVIRYFTDWRAANPQGTGAIILLTHLGGAPALLTMAGLGIGWLLWQGHRGRAALLAATVLGGRLGVELLKLLVDRSRPALDAHPVAVFSQSFPSGHAGNSMITYLALAVFAAPERWRQPAVVAAVLLALAIGATRPILGVHWPSDVLAGWTYGAVLVALMAGAARPRTEA